MRRGLALVLVFVAFACGREGELAVSTATPLPTTAAIESPSPEPSVEPTPEATESPEPSATETPEPTDDPCRGSTDEACGVFRWDPEPGKNGALTLSVSYTPKAPKAGDRVTFNVVAKDDGGTPALKSFAFGDGTVSSPNYKCVDQKQRYGPWTPPDPDPQDNTESFSYTYDHSGNFEAIVTFTTKRCDYYGYNPYGSEGSKRIKVDVAPDV